ncbi:MAG: carboxypeptidase regulatory-like domain-containing protein [Gemmatimonadota bacterium]
MRVYLSIAVLLLLAAPVSGQEEEKPTSAQEAALVGTVTILGTQRPLPAALVRLLGRDVSTVTDSVGAFRFTGLEPGWDTVQVRYLSYDSQKVPVRLEAGRSVVVDVKVPYPAAVLKELEVEITDPRLAGFRKRSQTSRGHYMNREQIVARRAVRMYQVFQRVPGTWSLGSDVFLLIRGGMSLCQPYLYVDGRRRRFARMDDLRPRGIEAIEVYREPYTPKQFTDIYNGCGSIVLWTRSGAR